MFKCIHDLKNKDFNFIYGDKIHESQYDLLTRQEQKYFLLIQK